MKSETRKKLKTTLGSILHTRREEASEKLYESLHTLEGYVLSFASFGTEINTWKLNIHLAKEGRLLLPKIDGPFLRIHHVDDVSSLKMGALGLMEPSRYDPTDLKNIATVLVPGLGFDKQNNRIGRGMGHYDRFLERISATTIGIGFKEQFHDILPTEPTDIRLSSIHLF